MHLGVGFPDDSVVEANGRSKVTSGLISSLRSIENTFANGLLDYPFWTTVLLNSLNESTVPFTSSPWPTFFFCQFIKHSYHVKLWISALNKRRVTRPTMTLWALCFSVPFMAKKSERDGGLRQVNTLNILCGYLPFNWHWSPMEHHTFSRRHTLIAQEPLTGWPH